MVISGLNYTTEQTGHSRVETASAAIKSVAVLPFDSHSCALTNLRTEKFLFQCGPFLSFASYSTYFQCDEYLLCLNGRKGVALIVIFETLF